MITLNPRHRHGRRRMQRIPKEFREQFMLLKAKQRWLYQKARPVEKALSKLYQKIGKVEEKERGTKIEIGRHGKKAESIKIGGVDLLKLVKRIERLEAMSKKKSKKL